MELRHWTYKNEFKNKIKRKNKKEKKKKVKRKPFITIQGIAKIKKNHNHNKKI